MKRGIPVSILALSLRELLLLSAPPPSLIRHCPVSLAASNLTCCCCSCFCCGGGGVLIDVGGKLQDMQKITLDHELFLALRNVPSVAGRILLLVFLLFRVLLSGLSGGGGLHSVHSAQTLCQEDQVSRHKRGTKGSSSKVRKRKKAKPQLRPPPPPLVLSSSWSSSGHLSPPHYPWHRRIRVGEGERTYTGRSQRPWREGSFPLPLSRSRRRRRRSRFSIDFFFSFCVTFSAKVYFGFLNYKQC